MKLIVYLKKIGHVGIVSSFAYSGANFFISFWVQSHTVAQEFGAYSFAILLIQFGLSLSNALFASPIVNSMAASNSRDLDCVFLSYFWANLIFCIISVLFLYFALSYLEMGRLFILYACIQAFLILMRWFFRAVQLAEHQYLLPATADLIYSGVLVIVGGGICLVFGPSAQNAMLSMLIATAISFAAIGREKFRIIALRLPIDLSIYNNSFKSHARWATLGVVTTELTANIHSYAIGLFLGVATLAPIASISLFFRPIPILMQSVTQYGRPNMAKLIAENNFVRLRRSVRLSNWGIATIAAINMILVISIITFFPRLIGGGSYSFELLWPIGLLLGLGQVIRSMRTGTSAALQSAGRYKSLAVTTVISAPISVFGAIVPLEMGVVEVAPVLVAVLLGEIVTAVLYYKNYKQMCIEVGDECNYVSSNSA